VWGCDGRRNRSVPGGEIVNEPFPVFLPWPIGTNPETRDVTSGISNRRSDDVRLSSRSQNQNGIDCIAGGSKKPTTGILLSFRVNTQIPSSNAMGSPSSGPLARNVRANAIGRVHACTCIKP